jgi:molecular chaperone HtpG
VKRVFITDDDRELMPGYLRFVRGVIDSEDIPLNVSRETLQSNRILTNIRASAVKKILSTLRELLENDRASYESFYEEFRRPMKEGLYQDVPNRDVIRDLLLYKSTAAEGWTTLSEYRERMKPDQKAVYYVTGGKENTLKTSPVTEMYRQKGIEVLVMDDEIDEIITPVMGSVDGKELISVNRSGAAGDIGDDSDVDEAEWKPFLERVKEVLKDEVKDVRLSSRLSESPSCIVVDETDPTVQMQHLMKVMGQEADVKPILEINPRHDILKKLKDTVQDSSFEDVSWILLDQALLIEGAEMENPTRFVGRLNRLVSRAL